MNRVFHIPAADWCDDRVAVVATGPSVAELDSSVFDGMRIIAVSGAFQRFCSADVSMLGDFRIFRRHGYGEFRKFKGNLVICCPSLVSEYPPFDKLSHDRKVYMRRGRRFGLSRDRAYLSGTRTSVALAINYAVHRGSKEIFLFGVDHKIPEKGRVRSVRDSEEINFDQYRRQRANEVEVFSKLVPDLADLGVSVFNANPDSALNVFPKVKM